MVYGIGNRCLKLLMFLMNFLIFVFGAIVFGISLWITFDKHFADKFRDALSQFSTHEIPQEIIDFLAKYQASLWIFIAVGGLIMVVGFLGCCGAACESVLLLTLFLVIVMILAIVQLFGLVYMQTGQDEFKASVRTVLDKTSQSAELRKQLSPLMSAFECCGATKETKNLYIDDKLCTDPKQEDCYTVIEQSIDSNGSKILIAGIVLLIVEAFALVFSCVLFRAFREGEAYSYNNMYAY